MKKYTVAIYPGTFDPITLGHEDIVRRASGLFDEVVVAVAHAHHKKTFFSLDARIDMVKTALAEFSNVTVLGFAGLLRDFACTHNGNVLVRGVRTGSDFDYEFQMAGMNRHLMPDVETVFFTPGNQHQFISSTFVREIASLGGDVSALVSPTVLKNLTK
jgi:pantetheine-phosphate adenylyltransferase